MTLESKVMVEIVVSVLQHALPCKFCCASRFESCHFAAVLIFCIIWQQIGDIGFQPPSLCVSAPAKVVVHADWASHFNI